jgi:hypothetical protein
VNRITEDDSAKVGYRAKVGEEKERKLKESEKAKGREQRGDERKKVEEARKGRNKKRKGAKEGRKAKGREQRRVKKKS